MGRPKSVVLDSIVEYAAERMAYRVRKFALKREISLILYGPRTEKIDGKVVTYPDEPAKNMDQHSYENIRSAARKLLHERSIIVQAEARDDSVGLYESILADPCASNKDRMLAQQQLDKIHRVVSVDGMPASTNLGFVPLDNLGLSHEDKVKILDAMTKKEQEEENVSDGDAATDK
jgi:hypothetical protein